MRRLVLAQRFDGSLLALAPGSQGPCWRAAPHRPRAIRRRGCAVRGARRLHELGQRRDVAVGGKHAVGDDQRAPSLGLADTPGQVIEIAVVVDEDVGVGEAAAVDSPALLASSEKMTSPGRAREATVPVTAW